MRGIAAIVDAPDIVFYIEERAIGNLPYKGVVGFREYDDFSYNFNFEYSSPGERDLVRFLTHPLKVNADMLHTMIVTGSIDNPVVLEWEDAEREWAETETVVEVTFANFSPAIGDVDVYFVPPGTTPVLGNAVGTLANGERLPPTDFAEGVYEIIITPAGDPTNILYLSGAIVTGVRNQPLIAIFDADPTIPSPVAVSLITAQEFQSPLPDPRFASQVRLYHAGVGTENADVYFDDDFTSPVISNLGFKELSPYLDSANGVVKVTLTAVNNPGAILLEREIVVTAGTLRTLALLGEPANLLMNVIADQARPLSTFAVMRIAHWAINAEFLTVYLLEPGTEITDTTFPLTPGLRSEFDTGFLGIDPGMHELTVTEFGSLVPIAAPIILDLREFDVADVAIIDTVDPAILESVIFDFR